MQVEQDFPASVLVRVYVLGPLEIWKKDPSGTWKLISKDKWKNSKPARSVFKRLLVQPGRRLARSTIEDDVWSESDNFELTAKNVYNAISLVRGIIGKPLLTCWEAAYEIAGQMLVWTDLDACAALLKEAENQEQGSIQAVPFLEQAVALLERGKLLEGEDGKWCYAFRKRAEDMHQQARLWLAEGYEAEGKLWQAGEQYRAIILTDPSDEEALQRWLEMLARHGKRQEALKCYRDMKDFVEAQGFSLSNELEQMFASLNQHLTLARTSPFQPFGGALLPLSIVTLPKEQPAMLPVDIIQSHLFSQIQWKGTGPISDELQIPLQRMLLDLESLASGDQEQSRHSRHQILVALAALPFMALSSGQTFTAAYIAEVFLPQCATSLVACNQLMKSQDFLHAEQTLSRLVAPLRHLVQQETRYQLAAAHLVTQCYLLLGILESHNLNWAGYKSYNAQAVEMSKLSADISLQAVAVVQLAMTFFQFEQPHKAQALYEVASPLVPQTTPLVQSDFYVKQAVAYAQAGQEKQAQECLERAHAAFPNRPEDDPSFLYADFGLSSFICWETTTQLQLAQRQLTSPEAAWKSLARSEHLPLRNLGRTQVFLHNLQAETALRANEMEQFIQLLTIGIQGANRIKSKRRLQQAMDCFQMACQQWPDALPIRQLADVFIETAHTS